MAWPLKSLSKTLKAAAISCLFLGIVAPSISQASDTSLHLEAMAKMGILNGSYTGQDATGRFIANGALEIEADLFTSPGLAWAIRSVIANDVATSRTRYFYTGIGQRYFFGPHGFESFAHDGADTMHIRPKLRYFIGIDAGIAQVLVIPYGKILGSYATTADGNAMAGARWGFSKSMSFDATVGMGVGTGISTMNVTIFTTRVLLGFVYAF